MKSHCGSILPQTLKELFEYMVGYIVITLQDILWKNSQWVAQIQGGYIVNKIVKETRVFFHKEPTGFCAVFFSNVITIWSLDTLWSKWCFFFKCNHNVIPGYIFQWQGQLGLSRTQLIGTNGRIGSRLVHWKQGKQIWKQREGGVWLRKVSEVLIPIGT